jgi:outer membrane protein
MIFSISKFFKKERRSSGALCVLLAALLGITGTANAAKPLTQAQVQVYETANEGQRVHFLIERAKMGQGELVETLLQRYPLQGPHAVNRTLFIQGLVLESKGDLTGAVKNYRAALARDPSLTLVRVQLAQALTALGQDDSAKHNLKLLESEAPDDQVAANIRSIVENIDAKRPLTFNGFLSVAPSTNLNNGSSHKSSFSANPVFGTDGAYIDISANSQRRSGVGAAMGVSADYTKRLGNHFEALLGADVAAQIYADRDYNSASFGQSAELRYHLSNGFFGLGAVANQSIDPNAHRPFSEGMTYHSYGPRVSALHFFGAHDILHASATYEWRDYAHSTALDGTALLSDVSLNHGFNATFNVTLNAGFDKVDSNHKDLSYSTYYGGVGFYKELPLGINLNGNAQARISKFDDVNPLFFVTREDQRYIGSVALTKRDLNFMGFAPALSYTYTRNVSNIAAYDYDSHEVDFRLTKDF